MTNINQIHVGPDGTFEPKGDFFSNAEDVEALLALLLASNKDSLTIHYHGGLVNEATGVEVAEMMKPVYEAANNHALSFVWETGLVETFRDNLLKINDTLLFKKLITWVARRTAQRFGGLHAKGVGEPVTIAEIKAELEKEVPFADYDSEDTGRGAARGSDIAVTEETLDIVREELEAEFEEDIEIDEEIEYLLAERDESFAIDSSEKGIFSSLTLARKLAKIAFRVIRRHVRNRDHGFHCTLVEEILREYYLADLGAWVWDRMKSKAEMMWYPNAGLIGNEQHVGSSVLEALQKLQQQRPDFKINLVGHSAGSIVICHMLRTIAERYPNIKINKVVFMAAAVRSDLALAEIGNHPERYEEFCFYTMADSFERDDVLVPFVYSRSLLYLISGILESDEVDLPIAGMMRHATQSAPFDSGVAREWAEFILNQNRTVLSDSTVLNPGAAQGRVCSAKKHGDFDNNLKMQESLTHILMS